MVFGMYVNEGGLYSMDVWVDVVLFGCNSMS